MKTLLEPLRAWYGKQQQQHRQIIPRPWAELTNTPLLQGKSIALVGNAGYLADLNQGDAIDQYDVVIRMNNFRVTGFEKFLGKKTDVWLTNFYTDINFQNLDARKAKTLLSSSPNNFRKLRNRGISIRHGQLHTHALCKLGRREVFVPTLPWFEKQIAQIGRYPSTGACGILLLLEHLLPISGSIYITGFTFFQCRSHYFTQAVVDPSTNHDAKREQSLLTDRLLPYIQNGRIQVDPIMADLLGTCHPGERYIA